MRSFHFIATLAALFPGAAFADSIDGDWCNRDGSHLRINGPTIELKPGEILQGKYARHAFSYFAPKDDSEFGTEIYFILRSEDEMRRVRDPAAMPEHADIWQRCQTTS
jgi:hypothetical protein